MSMFSSFLSWLRGEPPEEDPDVQEAFVLRLRTMVQTVDPSIHFDASDQAFVSETGTRAYVGNHWDRYRLAPEEEREGVLIDTARIIVSFGGDVPDTPQTWAETAPCVLPRLRPRHMYEVVALRSRLRESAPSDGPMATLRPLRGDLHVELAYDLPTAIQNLRPDKLREWGVDLDTAYSRALKNLADITPAGAFEAITDGLYATEVGDCYDSSRMLLVERVRALPLRGRPLALPANRDTLVITGEDDDSGVERLLQIAVQAMDQPRLDTVAPLVLTDEGWRAWLPPRQHRLHAEWRELELRDRGTAYSAVREALLALQEADIEPAVAIASFGALLHDGVPMSCTVWERAPVWLPRTELVLVVVEGRESLLVTRDRLLSELEGRVVPLEGVFPAYDAVDTAPTVELVDRLLPHALEVSD